MSNFSPINDNEYQTIERALAAYRLSGTVPCTACRYCMDCPAGVDIPKAFAIYNQYCVSKSPIGFLAGYHVLGESKQAHHCVGCKKCMEHCPQAIDIPDWMGKIADCVKELNQKND